jgi:hypothetical protein
VIDHPDKERVDIACRCGQTQSKSVGWVRSNRKITCACGRTTDFDSNALVQSAAAAAARRGPAGHKAAPARFGKRRRFER